MKIKDLGEFGLISRIAGSFNEALPAGWQGIGDDCAIIPQENSSQVWLVTTDMLVEKIHFLTGKITPYQLGYKSLAVNLSDIASMGGNPVATFLSVALPPDTDTEWFDRFIQGYKAHGVPLLGGDTTSSERDIVINITVLGQSDRSSVKRRSDARPGDLIAVTGNLGDSAAGLRLLLDGSLGTESHNSLIKAHLMPRPHLAEGEWLGRESGVHAMMDVSDGVASDLMHILRASGCAARVDTSCLPLSEALINATVEKGWNVRGLALGGGEDYVLLLTVSSSQAEDLAARYREEFGQELHFIGQITEGEPDIRWIGSNGEDYQGFTHF